MAMAFFGSWRSGWLGRRFGRYNQGRCGPSDGTFFNNRQSANGIVFHVDVDHAIFGFAKLFGKAKQVGAVKGRRLARHTRSQVGVAHNGDAVFDHSFTRLG